MAIPRVLTLAIAYGVYIISHIASIGAAESPRGRIQDLCPALVSRGLVDADSWYDCGEGAFHESREISVELSLMARDTVVYDGDGDDDDSVPEAFGGTCKGVVRMVNPRILKACLSTVDSREIRAILRAQLVCSSDGYGDPGGDPGGEAGADEPYPYRDEYYGEDGDDYFYYYNEAGPTVVEGLWEIETNIVTGEFGMDVLCLREVPGMQE